MALPLIGWVAKLFLENWIKGIFSFVSKHFKEILILVAVLGLFYGGMRYERIQNEKEIAALVQHYKEEQEKREREIDVKIKEVERSAREAANKLELEKAEAEANIKQLQQAYVTETTRRANRVKELEQKLKESEKLPKKERQVLEQELTELKLTYTLSPIAVETINSFVREYAK